MTVGNSGKVFQTFDQAFVYAESQTLLTGQHPSACYVIFPAFGANNGIIGHTIDFEN